MNKQLTSAIGGLAGAAALTLLNKTTDKIDKSAPRMDLLGLNAVAKLVKGSGVKQVVSGTPMNAALAGDLFSNTLYYGLANGKTAKETFIRGSLLGAAAGLGAMLLAKPLGLDERAARASVKTKAMTVAWYVLGGLAAATVISLLDKKTSSEK